MNFVTTPSLEMAYEVAGPEAGPVVSLAHGWPESPHCWNDVIPLLVDEGCRVFTPYMRGCSPTRFLFDDKMRSGQICAFAQDIVDFIDALDLKNTLLVGHDWGARAGYAVAALFPDRINALVALSTGYATNSPDYEFDYHTAHSFWYQWLSSIEVGRQAIRRNPKGLGRYLWEEWTPDWQFDEKLFEEAAATWENADWPEITIHAYAHRWGEAPGDPAYAELEAKFAEHPKITVPTVVIHGANDPGNPAASSIGREYLFSKDYQRIEIPKCGHLLPREAPEVLARSIIEIVRR